MMSTSGDVSLMERNTRRSTHQRDYNVTRAVADVQNGDFLSRLLAATPPYFHNTSLLPQGFIFSEMLKSLVQTKPHEVEEPNNSISWAKPCEMRKRKKQIQDQCANKQPTSESSSSKIPRIIDDVPPIPTPAVPGPAGLSSLDCMPMFPAPLPPPGFRPFVPLHELGTPPQPTPPPGSTRGPNTSHVLPRCPPASIPPGMWYPALYPGLPPLPPYGIDPLHFFIDLRVSGHIWDRPNNNLNGDNPQHGDEQQQSPSSPSSEEAFKLSAKRENSSPLGLIVKQETTENSSSSSSSSSKATGGASKSSAFSVPEKNADSRQSSSPQTSNEGHLGINYIMQNLRGIYNKSSKSSKSEEEEEQASGAEQDVSGQEDEDDGENGGKKRNCKDLPALIGLELVVDYVQHDKKGATKKETSDEESGGKIS